MIQDDLSDGEDEIEAALRNVAIDLRRPGIVQLAFRLLADELGRYFAERLDVGAPVVDPEQIKRHVAVHVGDLRRLHGRMSSQRGKNGPQTLAIVLPCVAGQFARTRMKARLIRRNSEHTVACTEPGQAFGKQIFQLR